MAARLRDAITTLVTGTLVAGAVVGVALPMLPSTWRRPSVAWAVLLCSVAAVARFRQRRRIAR